MRLDSGGEFRLVLNNLKTRLAEADTKGSRLHRRVTLRQIEEALERLDDGTYGICAGCFLVMPKGELLMRPYTKLCAACRARRAARLANRENTHSRPSAILGTPNRG